MLSKAAAASSLDSVAPVSDLSEDRFEIVHHVLSGKRKNQALKMSTKKSPFRRRPHVRSR